MRRTAACSCNSRRLGVEIRDVDHSHQHSRPIAIQAVPTHDPWHAMSRFGRRPPSALAFTHPCRSKLQPIHKSKIQCAQHSYEQTHRFADGVREPQPLRHVRPDQSNHCTTQPSTHQHVIQTRGHLQVDIRHAVMPHHTRTRQKTRSKTCREGRPAGLVNRLLRPPPRPRGPV